MFKRKNAPEPLLIPIEVPKPFDYMNYFFKADTSLISKTIIKKLDQYSDEEMKNIGIDVLSVSLSVMRCLAEEPNGNKRELQEFHRAIIWHLSDAVHNIPTHLDNQHNSLRMYVANYFEFVFLLEQLKNKPSSHYPSLLSQLNSYIWS